MVAGYLRWGWDNTSIGTVEMVGTVLTRLRGNRTDAGLPRSQNRDLGHASVCSVYGLPMTTIWKEAGIMGGRGVRM
jgi:hypothetical protein